MNRRTRFGVYGRVQAEGDPRVVETDGSTVEVRWVPLPELASLDVTDLVTEIMKVVSR